MTKKLILVFGLLEVISLSVQAGYQCDQVIQKTGFEICYNYKLKGPLWSKATLTYQSIKKKGYSRKGIHFYQSVRKTPPFMAGIADLKPMQIL